MKTLLRSNLRYLIISGIIIAIAMLIFNYTWSFGFTLGFVFSFVTVGITESQIDSVLFNNKKGIQNYIGFIIGNMVYVIPFLISIFLNHYFNIIFVAFGLLYFKYFMFIQEGFFKKRETNVKQ
ncbi:MAG: hypothetical protein Q8T08_04810 [Ignavibacteria bacterium]|nr:hypothetical protein [Ignavibacteria bacterium]